MAFLLIMLGISAAPRSAAEDGSPFLWVEATEAGCCTVFLSVSMYDLTEGEAMALLLEVEAPRGYGITSVEACEGAAGLTLTAGGETEGILRVLLDGYAEKLLSKNSPKTPLFRVFFSPASPHETGREGMVTVSAPEDGEIILYCLNAVGEVETFPLSVRVGEPWDETETDTGDGDVTQPVTEPTDTETDTHETQTSSPPPPLESHEENQTTQPPRVIFLGCRETPVAGGVYEVQFIFAGSGEGTPVVCAEGGGVLTLRVTKGDFSYGDRAKAWRLCTFSDLEAGRRYRFVLYLNRKTVTVEYENGVFLGYGE